MDIAFVRIRSWHALRADGLTVCGRSAAGRETSDTLPAGKSCESCARIIVRASDQPEPQAVKEP